MLNKISIFSICLFLVFASSESVKAQQENSEETICKVTLEESGERKVLMVPRSQVSQYHNNPNLVGINCRNEAEGKR